MNDRFAALLNQQPFALLPEFITPEEARALRALYGNDALFRSRVIMEAHAFGSGEYKYFANPLPPRIVELRDELYSALRPIANAWMRAMGYDTVFPQSHQVFLDDCFASEQKRPTALLLRYRSGDYNRLHQDIYGPIAFPLQATIYLSRPGEEFNGGEVVLAEQKPRGQTRVHVLNPSQGDLLILPTRAAPVSGSSGTFRAAFRHGVATITAGERYSLGIILHDAK